METSYEEIQKLFGRITAYHNESIRVKREYHNTLIAVVGVCFGVLVAMKDNVASELSNKFYFAGLICCALSLFLLVIGARGPIVAYKNKTEQLKEELVDMITGRPTNEPTPKSIKFYGFCEKAGRFLFYATIVLFCIYSFYALFR